MVAELPTSMRHALRFFDCFAGVGGFRLGLERDGMKCVAWCEIDKYNQQTYRANFNITGEFFWPDATTLDTETLPGFDVLVAGFPCQSFSTSGHRLGFDDARGTLFFDLVRILRDRRPAAFLFENVQGLVFHDKGKTLSTILSVLAADVNSQTNLLPSHDCLGYHVHWRVLNSKDFGVPQNRKRIFFVGFRDPPVRPFKFPEGEPLTVRLADLLEKDAPEKYYLSERLVQSLAEHIANHKPKRGGKSTENWGDTIILETAQRGANMRDSRLKRSDVARTIDAAASEAVIEPEVLQANVQVKAQALLGGRPRRFTPRETARLQGFPNSFVLPCSDAQSYRQMGNAVTVSVVKAVGRQIAGALLGS